MAKVTHLVKEAEKKGEISRKTATLFLHLYTSYSISFKETAFPEEMKEKLFTTLLEMVMFQTKNPFHFDHYHKKLRTPFDYYRFGLDFIRPIVREEKSAVLHLENVQKMVDQLAKKENVILFANHQTEVDPQLINIAVEKNFPEFGEELIFVAGDRVITDPIAVPFSQGRNLLCVYSRRHIENPPEKKEEKRLHNRRTMHRMKELLQEGGHAICVYPSGGRDRANAEGIVQVAHFDPDTIALFLLMAREAKRETHFYPLALSTYAILPPPSSIEKEIGEVRKTSISPIRFSFGNEIDTNHFPGHDNKDRHAKRIAFAQHVWELVNHDYNKLREL